ncbi:MAG: SRPBCC domain-containing protein [Actinomycetes bacterium]
MAQLLISQVINAPVEKVWPLISDLTQHSLWSPKPHSIELVSGAAGAVGSRYQSVGEVPPADKHHKNEVEITEVIPNSKFVFEAYDENGTFINTFTLTPVGSGTKVTFQHDFPRMVGMGRILLPLLLPIVGKRDGMVRLGLLKSIAEKS